MAVAFSPAVMLNQMIIVGVGELTAGLYGVHNLLVVLPRVFFQEVVVAAAVYNCQLSVLNLELIGGGCLVGVGVGSGRAHERMDIHVIATYLLNKVSIHVSGSDNLNLRGVTAAT